MSEETKTKKKKKSGSSIRTSSPTQARKKRGSSIFSSSKLSQSFQDFDKVDRSPSRSKSGLNTSSLPPLSPELTKKLFTGKSLLLADFSFQIADLRTTSATNNPVDETFSFSWKRGAKAKNRGIFPLSPAALPCAPFQISATFSEQPPPKKSSSSSPAPPCFQPKLIAFSLMPAAPKKTPRPSFKSSQTVVVDLSELVLHAGTTSHQLIFPTGFVLDFKITVDWRRLNGKKVVPLDNPSSSSSSASSPSSNVHMDFGLMTDNENVSDDDVTDIGDTSGFSDEEEMEDDEDIVSNKNNNKHRSSSSSSSSSSNSNSNSNSNSSSVLPALNSLKSPSRSGSPASSKKPAARSSSPAAPSLSEEASKKVFTGKSLLSARIAITLRALKSTSATDHSMAQEYVLCWKRGAKSKNKGTCTFHPDAMELPPIALTATFAEQPPPKKPAAFSPRFQPKFISFSVSPAASKRSAKPTFRPSYSATADLAEWVLPAGVRAQQLVFPCGLCADLQVDVQWLRLNGKKVVPLQPSPADAPSASSRDDFGLVTDNEDLSDGDDATDLDSAPDCFDEDDPAVPDSEPPPSPAPPPRPPRAPSSPLASQPSPAADLRSPSTILRGRLSTSLAGNAHSPLIAELSAKLNTPLRSLAQEAPLNPTHASPTLDSSPQRHRALCGGPPGRRPPSRGGASPNPYCISNSAPSPLPHPAPKPSASSPNKSPTSSSSISSSSAPVLAIPSAQPRAADAVSAAPPLSPEISKKLFTGKSTLLADMVLLCRRLTAAKADAPLEGGYTLSWKRGIKSKNRGTCKLPNPESPAADSFRITASFQEQPVPKKSSTTPYTPRFQEKPISFTLAPSASKKSSAKPQTVVADLAEWVVHSGETVRPIVFPNGVQLDLQVTTTWQRLNGKKVVPIDAAKPGDDRASNPRDDFGLVTDNENLSEDASDLDSMSDFSHDEDLDEFDADASTTEHPTPDSVFSTSTSTTTTTTTTTTTKESAATSGRSRKSKKKTAKKKKPSRLDSRQAQSQSSLGLSSGPLPVGGPVPFSSSARDEGKSAQSPALAMLAELKPPPQPNLEKLLCRDCSSSIDFEECVSHIKDCARLRAAMQERIQSLASEYITLVGEPPSEAKDMRLVSFVLSLDPSERMRVLEYSDPSLHRTPLMVSAIKGDMTSVQVLLHCGVGLTQRDTSIERKSALDLSASTGHHEVMAELLPAGAPLPLMGGRQQYSGQRATPLHYAVRSRSYASVILLLQHKIDPSYPDQLGKTPLHLAVEMKNPKMVATLVRHGASPTRPGGMKQTPLQLAQKLGFRQCAEAMEKPNPEDYPEAELTEDAASLRSRMTQSDSNLSSLSEGNESSDGTDVALDSSSDDDIDSQELAAAYYADQCKVALDTYTAQATPAAPQKTRPPAPNAGGRAPKPKPSKTSLADTIIGSDTKDLRFEAEMRVHNKLPPCPIKPKSGFSNIVHRFVLAGDWEALRNFEGRTEQLDQGVTPLFLCAYASSFQRECTSELIGMGANVNFMHVESGWTPLHAAAHNNQAGVLELLIAHGANLSARTVTDDLSIKQQFDSFMSKNPVLSDILLVNPPPVVRKYENYSALDLAIGYKSMDAVRVLKRVKAPAFKYIYAYRIQN